MNGDPLESNFVVDVMEKKIRVHRDALPVNLILEAPKNVRFTTIVKGKEVQ